MNAARKDRLIRFGIFELDLQTGELRKAGQKLRMQEQPFRVLLALLERPGEVVTREELQRKVWNDDTVVDFDTGLNKAVTKIRELLDDSAGSPRFIETLPRRGYRFIAPVEELGVSLEPPDSTALPAKPEASPPVEVPQRKPFAAKRAFTIVVAILLGGLGIWSYLRWRSNRQDSTRLEIHAIAVLPLLNLSADPNQEYFTDGMTDELITDLAQIHSLRVISRTSVVQFKGTHKGLPEIARELNVDAVVEGSVLRSGDQVRITAQLLDARRDRHLWAESYERRLVDIVGLQRQVAQAIAGEVRAKLTLEESAALAKRPATNPRAYQAMLEGEFFWRERNPAATLKAIDYFKQSVAIDPGNARAWSGLAGCYVSLGADIGSEPPSKEAPLAHAAVERALALDPQLAEAHIELASIHLWFDWDWAGAEREFQRGLALNPNEASAHRSYSHYLQLLGRFDEAVNENRRAIDLAPLETLNSVHLAWLYVDARQPAKALEQSRKAIELDPGFVGIYYFIGDAYEQQGSWAAANAAYSKLKDSYGAEPMMDLARIDAESGDRGKALAELGRLIGDLRRSYVSPVGIAGVYAALADRESSFSWLDRAFRERAADLASIHVSYRFDSLRKDARFQELERRVGFR